MTGSETAIASATAAKAACAGLAPQRQLSVRSGQIIQHPEWGPKAPGMRNPSAVGVLWSGALIAAIIAVANRAPIRLSLDPFSDAHPALVFEMPLYLLLFAVLLLGVCLGGLAVMLRRATKSKPTTVPESIERAIVPLDGAHAQNDSSEL